MKITARAFLVSTVTALTLPLTAGGVASADTVPVTPGDVRLTVGAETYYTAKVCKVTGRGPRLEATAGESDRVWTQGPSAMVQARGELVNFDGYGEDYTQDAKGNFTISGLETEEGGLAAPEPRRFRLVANCR